MCRHLLIAYGSRFGSTAEIARGMRVFLEDAGITADVMPVDDVESLDGYDAVILGSAVRRGAWLPEAVDFLDSFADQLASLPVAYFTICLTLEDDTPENRRIVSTYHQPLLHGHPEIVPVSVGMFAGSLDFNQLPPLSQLIVNSVEFPRGDFRNWQVIRRWVDSVVAKLHAKSVAIRSSQPLPERVLQA